MRKQRNTAPGACHNARHGRRRRHREASVPTNSIPPARPEVNPELSAVLWRLTGTVRRIAGAVDSINDFLTV